MGLEKVEALQNLVVLDLTRVVAGPYAGSILGDFGAEVIKSKCREKVMMPEAMVLTEMEKVFTMRT